MPTKRKSRSKRASPKKPIEKPEIEPGGEVRTHYTEITGADKVPVPIVSEGTQVVKKAIVKPGELIPEGKLELGKEYRLKGGQFVIVESRNVGTDPGQTKMVVWKKGFPQADHTVKWSPSIEGVELYVEKFIFDNLEEE